MKKFYSLILCFILSVVLLTGCTTDPNITSITTYASTENIWEYYYDYVNIADSFNSSIIQQTIDLKNNDNVAQADAQKFLTINANQHLYKNIIRDCIAVIDIYENNEKQALFEFENNITDYTVKQVTPGYKVTYNEKILRNLLLNCNSKVDNLIFNVPLLFELNINLEKSDSNIYNIKTIVQNITMPSVISAYEDVYVDNNGNTVILKLEVTQNQITTSTPYTQTTLIASEVITNPNGGVISKYEREAKYILQNNHFYLRDTIKIDDVLKNQQNIRLDNSYSNTALKYDRQIGYLSYDLKYNLAGNMTVFGEIYFQGQNKYVSKEYVNILQGSPFGLTQSYVTETNFSNTVISKTKYTNDLYVNIRDQDFNTFAMHLIDDGSSVCTNITENQININFYS